MPFLLEWGEEIDLSCVCVAETVFFHIGTRDVFYDNDREPIRPTE